MIQGGNVFTYLQPGKLPERPLTADGKYEAELVILEGGAANHVYDSLTPEERDKYKPNYIKGDHHLIRKEVLEFYGSLEHPLASSVVEDTSADTTGLEKCLKVVETWRKQEAYDQSQLYVAVLGAIGSRLDHELSALNTLYTINSREETKGTVALLDDKSLGIVLRRGHQVLTWHPEFEGPTCGIIPIGSKVAIATDGLKWNLQKDRVMSMGGLISNSNEIVKEQVVLDTPEPVLWTTALRPVHPV